MALIAVKQGKTLLWRTGGFAGGFGRALRWLEP
jgi:hypothetical protein